MKTRLDERALSTIALTAGVGVFVGLSFLFGPVARRVPLVVGSITLALLIYQCRRDIARRLRPGAVVDPRRRRRELAMLAAIVALAVLPGLVGPGPAAALYVLVHLRVLGGETWAASLGLAGGFWVLTTALLRFALQVQLSEGALWTWLGRVLG